tara:strand:+ start:1064 stop:1279 length:216 start_codon:yes stop_codon:yes gene_type:complete
MRNFYFRGIQIIIEQIDSKPLKNKSFIKSKNFTKILKKSYKGIIAGGTGLGIAAKSIIDTSRKIKREEENL